MADGRQLADPGHEQFFARQVANEPDPERWVAANVDGIGSWSQGRFRFADPAVDRWVAEVNRILESKDLVERARRKYPELTGEPYAPF